MIKVKALVATITLFIAANAFGACQDIKKAAYAFRASAFSNNTSCYYSEPSYKLAFNMYSSNLKSTKAIDVDESLQTVDVVLQSLLVSDNHSDQFRNSIRNFMLILNKNRTALRVNQDNGLASPLSLQLWQADDVSNDSYWRSVVINPLNEQKCVDAVFSKKPECEKLFDELKPVLSVYSGVYYDIVRSLNHVSQVKDLEKSRWRRKSWDSYFNDTQFQTPLELIINKIYHGGFTETVYSKDPPATRLIFLHPDAGATYGTKLPDGDRVNLALLIEWAGVMWWPTGYDRDGKGHPIGLSLISTYADLPNTRDSGLGILGFYKYFGLGVSWHGDKALAVVNLNLGRLIQDNDYAKKMLGETSPKM